MDISRLSLKFDDSKEFEIIDPLTNRPGGGFITIASINSKVGKSVQLELFRQMLLLKAEKAKLENKEPNEVTISDDELKEKYPHIFAELILDFRGLKDGKKDFKFSKENAIKLLQSSNLVYEMIDNYSSNQGLFIKE